MVALEILFFTDSIKIYNSRNLMVALEVLFCFVLVISTTVEILWWLQRPSPEIPRRNLQQQKSYGGFREFNQQLFIKSTTVEILWWLQRPNFYMNDVDLQQQKSYGGFRDMQDEITRLIYNSRNLMVALECIRLTHSLEIYNSRNLMVALERYLSIIR